MVQKLREQLKKLGIFNISFYLLFHNNDRSVENHSECDWCFSDYITAVQTAEFFFSREKVSEMLFCHFRSVDRRY